MREKIESALAELADLERVQVLFACESGSRAWGFASPDSDYDVRFLYVHPVEGYLTVRERRDTMEAMLPDDLDLAGWDLRKALALMTKSNPSLYEWLRSPIVYVQNEAFMAEFCELSERWYSERRIFYHYLHMAQGNWRSYLQGEEISRKKYLYVLRPTLACLWIQQGRGLVPMEFDTLRISLEGRPLVQEAIEVLLRQKMSGNEWATGAPDPVLHEFLAEELDLLAKAQPQEQPEPDREELDAFFRRWVFAN